MSPRRDPDGDDIGAGPVGRGCLGARLIDLGDSHS